MKDLLLRLGSSRNPLVVHNPRLAVPTDEYSQRLGRMTAKRGKTLDDHYAIARVEWEGGLYFDADLGPYVPATWVMSSLWQSAKLTKNGEGLRRALAISAPDGSSRVAIQYDGSRNLDELYAEERFRLTQSIPQGRVRVTRTRPRFLPWTLEALAVLDESLMDQSVLEEIAVRAGKSIGIGEKVDGLRSRYTVDTLEAP